MKYTSDLACGILHVRLWLLLYLVFVVASMYSAEASQSPSATNSDGVRNVRLFACTHSFALYVPEFLGETVRLSGQFKLKLIGISRIPGSSVMQHWNVPDETNLAKKAITAGKVDVLTLTPLAAPDDGVKLFAEMAFKANPNVRIAIQESWAPFEVPFYFPIPKEFIESTYWKSRNEATVERLMEIARPGIEGLDNMVRSVNENLGHNNVFVIPAAQALITLRGMVAAGQIPAVKDQESLFADKLGHPGPVVRVLVGYCHFAVIYQHSPIGLPVPSWIAKLPQATQLNEMLQRIAWKSVLEHPLSGVKDASR